MKKGLIATIILLIVSIVICVFLGIESSQNYSKGYDDGAKDIAAYEQVIDKHIEKITSLESTISELHLSVDGYLEDIENLELNLNAANHDNDRLNNLVNDLREEAQGLNEQIELLNETIADLESQIADLQKELNASNTSLEEAQSYIEALELELETLQYTQINALNQRIAELEATIEYYEQFLNDIEMENKVIVTFEFNGSVYEVQTIDKNSTTTIDDPESNKYVIFNGWTVDGEPIDLSSYTFTESTKVIADVTLKYDVKFMVDGEEYNTQLIIKDQYVTLPTPPTKEGYQFDGWTINGTDIVNNVESIGVTSNMTYSAVFTKLHSVVFIYEDQTISTQTVRNGENAEAVSVESNQYKEFNGWMLNDEIVDISSYLITSSVVLIADITYRTDVIFMIDNEEYARQVVEIGSYASLETPTKLRYKFTGWTLNGSDVIDLSKKQITESTTFYGSFVRVHAFERIKFSHEGESLSFYENCIWSDGETIYYSYNEKQYIVDTKSMTLTEKIWFGLTSFSGDKIWSDGENIYYTDNFETYILDKQTSTWSIHTFANDSEATPPNGHYIWNFNGETYFQGSAKFDKINNKWIKIDMGLDDALDPDDIWSDGENIYCNVMFKYYILNQGTMTWLETKINLPDGLLVIQGRYVWTDGEYIYYSDLDNKQYVLNKETNNWETMSWDGIDNLMANFIWSDGTNIYYGFSYILV